MVNRLGIIENVFLYAIAKGRSRHLSDIAKVLHNLGVGVECKRLCRVLAEESVSRIERINPGVIRFYENRAMGRAETIEEIFCYTDEIIDPLLDIISANQSKTFRKLTRSEAKYICRAMFLFVDRPFVESDPIAGTEEHIKIIADNLERLLMSKN